MISKRKSPKYRDICCYICSQSVVSEIPQIMPNFVASDQYSYGFLRYVRRESCFHNRDDLCPCLSLLESGFLFSGYQSIGGLLEVNTSHNYQEHLHFLLAREVFSVLFTPGPHSLTGYTMVLQPRHCLTNYVIGSIFSTHIATPMWTFSIFQGLITTRMTLGYHHHLVCHCQGPHHHMTYLIKEQWSPRVAGYQPR